MKFCREYAIASGYDYWDNNLEDEFINLYHGTTRERVRNRVFYCDGLEITNIRIDTKGKRFVKMRNSWQSYPDAVREEAAIIVKRHFRTS